tara:strand:+ start:6609 stop:6956 length:348 start_codon:yes stop_codon:yes gene_type:complete
MPITPPIIGPDLSQWGRQLNQFLQQRFGKIVHKVPDDNPSENGVFLWDDTNGYAVISHSNAFLQSVLKRNTPTSNTGAAGDKAGYIAWDTNYIYVCVANYDGSTAIWKRVALSAW